MNANGSLKKSLALLCALTVLLSLSACTLRLDSPPQDLPTLSASQDAYNTLTLNDHALFASAQTLSADNTVQEGLRTAIGQIGSRAKLRLDTLGGLWNPWPEGKPEDAQDPPSGPTHATSPEGFLELLQSSQKHAFSCAQSIAEGGAAQLCALNAASLASDTAQLSALGISSGLPELMDSPAKENPITLKDDAAKTSVQDALSSLDAQRYTLEVVAARLLADKDLGSHLLLFIQGLSRQTDTLVAMGIADTRQGQYPVEALDLPVTPVDSAAPEVLDVARKAGRNCLVEVITAHTSLIGVLPVDARGVWVDALLHDTAMLRHLGATPDEVFDVLWSQQTSSLH